MHSRSRIIAVAFVVSAITGCMPIPTPLISQPITSKELESHVRFLAQPALRGRKPRTPGSRWARRYIAAQFRALGLRPWGADKDFEQSFNIGTNLVGVLPGSDPTVAEEFVIVSAHYDHLGRTARGLHLGAADNAAGVAAMLEIAQAMATAPTRPRRSVVFAAWDMEEVALVGSYAFTCRQDFDPSHLAGVVNMDCMGRHNFEVLDNTLALFGTEHYPQARLAALKAGGEAMLEVLPLGHDLVGPRSDHVSFESYGAPSLFFSSGVYRDYHKPSDTADAIDYPLLARQATVVGIAATALADAVQVERPVEPVAGDREELRSLQTLFDAIVARPRQAGVDETMLSTLRAIAARVGKALEDPQYSIADRGALIADITDATLPLVLGQPVDANARLWLLSLNEVYAFHTDLWNRCQRELIRHVTTHPPGLFARTPPFIWEGVDAGDRTIHLAPTGRPGEERLSVLAVYLRGDLNSGVHGSWLPRDITGTRPELIDCALLEWLAVGGPYGPVWRCILTRLAETDAGPASEDWMRWRLGQTGNPDPRQWLEEHLHSGNPSVRSRAIFAIPRLMPEKVMELLTPIVLDESADPASRFTALYVLCQRPTVETLKAIAPIAASDTPRADAYVDCASDPNYPFYHRAGVRLYRSAPTTLGDAAAAWLARWTGQKLGKDPAAWGAWIEAHDQELRQRVKR